MSLRFYPFGIFLFTNLFNDFNRFNQITELGRKLLKTNPNSNAILERIDRLTAEQEAILRGWNEKEDWLQQCLQLQLFNKEADKIDAATSSHQAFLEFSNLGVSFLSLLLNV